MKRAVWEGTVHEATGGGHPEREGSWRCYHDGQTLVAEGGYHVIVEADLASLPTTVEGLPAFGLAVRTRTRGKSLRGGRQTSEPTLPIYAYCPRPGCGRGQRIG